MFSYIFFNLLHAEINVTMPFSFSDTPIGLGTNKNIKEVCMSDIRPTSRCLCFSPNAHTIQNKEFSHINGQN